MRKIRRMLIPSMDLTGMQIGYWLINGPAPPMYDKRGRTIKMWDCTCRCGTRKDVRDAEIRRGESSSCGCYNREISSTHHSSRTRLYEIWHGMKQRCNNPRSKDAHNYSERGIAICQEWNDSFESFRDWAISNGYQDGLSIDRIDVNGNYCPENCRWSTASEQCRNTRVNHLLTFNGKTQPIASWADETGIDYYTLSKRIEKGWSVDRALTQPVDHRKNKYKDCIRKEDSNVSGV